MKIYVILSERKLVHVEVKNSDSVVSIKEKIEAEEGILVMSECLTLGGIPLEDDNPLSSYKITHESRLQLGKTHFVVRHM